jgi:hypothetical protein
MSTEDRLPAEMREPPTTEPTVEVGVGDHVPPEAAVIAVAGDAGSTTPPERAGAAGPSYEALAAAEGVDQLPAELRGDPAPPPAAEVPDGAGVPPEAASSP